MLNEVVVEETFEEISRKFVHRNDPEARERYESIADLCHAVSDLRTKIEFLDNSDSTYARFSEYWLRLLNDIVSYLEDWPLQSYPHYTEVASRTLNKFQADILKRSQSYSQTQKVRLNSIGLRACQVTKQPVLTDIIEQFGETLTL